MFLWGCWDCVSWEWGGGGGVGLESFSLKKPWEHGSLFISYSWLYNTPAYYNQYCGECSLKVLLSLLCTRRGCLHSSEAGSPSASMSRWTSCSNWVPALGSPPAPVGGTFYIWLHGLANLCLLTRKLKYVECDLYEYHWTSLSPSYICIYSVNGSVHIFSCSRAE